MRTVISRRMLLAASAAATATGPHLARAATPDPLAALVAAAKAEGTVAVYGPPIDTVREALTAGFEKAYGIPVAYNSSGGSVGARVRSERAAGRYTLDVLVSGGDTPIFSFLPNGWLDKVEPALVAPDVVDPRKWKDGHLWYVDPQHTMLRTHQFVTPELAINTKLVRPGEIKTWHDLLDPKWRGKIVAKDPSVAGAGSSLTAYFYLTFGADFVKQLYRDQAPMLSRDFRQAASWLAQGTYPILVGPDSAALAPFQKLGYPLTFVFPSDGPGVLTGGYGFLSLVNRAPHPNAAKLFVNWLAGRAGQEVFARSIIALSLRTDVPRDTAPPFANPQKNVKYMDTYDYTFITEQRDAAFEKVRELLGL